MGDDRPGEGLPRLSPERRPIVPEPRARVIQPAVVREIVDHQAEPGPFERPDQVLEDPRRRIQAMDEEDRRPSGIVRPIRLEGVHPIIRAPSHLVLGARGEVLHAPFPLGEDSVCRKRESRVTTRASGSDAQRRVRAERIRQHRAGQSPRQADDRQPKFSRRPGDGQAGGVGEARDQLGDINVPRGADGDLDLDRVSPRRELEQCTQDERPGRRERAHPVIILTKTAPSPRNTPRE